MRVGTRVGYTDGMLLTCSGNRIQVQPLFGKKEPLAPSLGQAREPFALAPVRACDSEVIRHQKLKILGTVLFKLGCRDYLLIYKETRSLGNQSGVK